MDMDQQREDALQDRGSCCWFPETGQGMDIGEKGEDALQDRSSCWMPAAPYRPILPRPPQSKPHQEMLMASNTLAFGAQENEGNRVLMNFRSPDLREENRFFHYGAVAGTGYSVGASAESQFNGMDQWKGVKCVELLALADASVAVSAGDAVLHGTGSAVLGETQYELPFGHHPYDLNLLPGTTDAAGLSKIIPQFAPITPDKARRVDRVQDSEIPNSNADDRRDHEIQEQSNAGAATINILELENNKDPSKLATDSSHATLSTQLQENHNPDKGGINSIDLNKTPQQKPRRRKHRPKVITEGKPKRTPKPSGPEENQRVRRKYVRKNALNKNTTPPPPEELKEHTDSKKLKSTKRSCRRALNFDIEEPRDGSSSCRSLNLGSESQAPNGVQSKSTGQLGNGIESVIDNTQIGIAHELFCSANRMLKDHLSLFEQQAPTTPHPTGSSSLQEKLYVDSQNEDTTEGKGQVSTHIGRENTKQTMLDSDTRSSPRSPNDSNCSTTIIATKEKEQGKGSKRKYSNAVEQADPRTRNFIGANYNNLQAYYKMMSMMSWVHFPNIYKKKRTDKGQNPAVSSSSYHVSMAENVGRQSNASYWAFGPQFNASNVSTTFGEAGRGPQNKQQAGEYMLPLYQTEMSKKRRSRGPTRVRDLASLTRTPEHILQRTYLTKQPPADGNGQRVENCDRTQTCIDALVTEVGATLAKKKRTKRTSLSSSSRSVVIYKKPSFAKSSGVLPKAAFKLLSVDAITEQLKRLDINRESSKFAYQGYNVISNTQNQEHNALVLYRRDDTVVPFEGSFDPTKKRRTRAKVDLDEETDRVWKLLLENINNEGIDGTDEQKAKWWEEERRVFRGRADSFIARMHLVQGDRRFSPWKGSVVDSVVGVFLTQNVSDHLSSSAFMSVAAHFPLKSRSNQKSCYEEVESLVEDETEVCISENSNQPVCDWSSITFNDSEHSEEKVASINENSGSTTEGVISTNETECKLSHSSEPCQGMYHNSVNRSTANITRMASKCHIEEDMRTYDVVSSQNSVDSSTSQTVEKSGSCESNSETEDPPNPCKNSSLDHSTSFVELLQKAESTMLREVYSHRSSHMSSHDKSNYEHQPICMQHDDQRQNLNREEAFLDPSSDCCLHPTLNPGVLQVECFDLFREVTQSSNTSKNTYEDNLGEQSALTAESASQDTIHNKLTMNVQEAPRCSSESCISIQEGNNMVESQIRVIGTLNNVETLAQEQSNKMQHNCLNISGETIDVMQKETEPDLNEQGHSINKEFSKRNATISKAKNRRAGKEKKDQLDWDKLRKEAESNGRKREKTPNTMDSLDWEAVRCADVSEIAQTIKERGMNNMLAERIKDFLNRLVREHGSINLEWLRDVPPDQAKEYLLSFRGLGLKSVECVRLLTLHHLAFPVDTNVGRIAVRLGWVPLQPLPESLQLHLLELYPVLESIQKYLWPRLCKLDQRTLYELHYQMITFGKVFCTKNKPNCNACPMRGDCRHFASAFASARLALPGPEERSIVSATEDRTAYPNAAQMNNKVPLPLPQATKQLKGCQQLEAGQQSETKPAVGNCEPIIEEPATPEPECTEIIEDIEDLYEDPNEIPTIKLNIEQFTQNLQTYMQENMELQEGEMSKALVSLTPEAASIPTPKLKNVSRLRTEHQVYELPDSHPLVEMLQLEKREPDDPCNYLLAIWTPGETANSIQPPEKRCSSQELGKLCDDKECFSCNSAREANSQKVRGTLLIPCRTAMRGSFPLNGTYFQVNEVFADHDSSLNPIDVPRAWLWKLNRRTVYFGTSIPTIFKGLTTPAIQQCFWKGYVCVRGFDQKTRAPRPLMARLHFPASKLSRPKGRGGEE